MGKAASPSASFKGWKFSAWLVGNWKTIKEILKVGIPLAVSWSATHSPAWTGFITICGKFVLDSGEYWFKEYTK